ncbi:CaiB/BaiF CoA transferase family protein [Variovorax sp. M-6]|uniref:CaiB/BaiF CoA transferase family protein n=1 Tax=Variovorax sp. M-6 TaxID=3233041 RepID=UPI003F9E6783
MPTENNNPPLQGLKVVDLTRVLAGPLCTQILGDFGADIIKVEPPSGDQSRGSGPPFHDGSSSMFYGLNRNKRSIVIDLNSDEGKSQIRQLIRTADVLVHNFKPGTMERWGLSFDDLKEQQSRLIMVAISGFGTDGPLGGTPGYDGSAGAWTGVISANGDQHSGPMRIGLSVVDVSTGLHAAIGVLLALKALERDGVGQYIDMSLYDCAFPLLHPHAANWLYSNVETARSGNQHPTFTPMGVYDTSDDPIYLAVSTDRNFHKLCEILDISHVLEDERFTCMANRAKNRSALIDIINSKLKQEKSEELALKLNKADIPAGAVLSVAQALSHPHAEHRQMVVSVHDQKLLGIPIKLSRTPGRISRLPPNIDADRADILAEMGS